MGTLKTEAFQIMFYGITEIFYWGFIVTGWWLAIIKVTQIMEAVNQNMPRSAAQLKMQHCLRIALWRSDALGVSHLSRN